MKPYSGLLVGLAVISCHGNVEPVTSGSDAIELAEPVELARVPMPVELPSVDPNLVVTDVLDQASLAIVQESGFTLAEVLGGRANVSQSAAWMAVNVDGYAALAQAWTASVQGVVGRLDVPLVVEHEDALAFPAGNVGRSFDVRWLDSEKAFYSLAAVINRLDRREFTGQDGCGEVRLIYRLGYRDQIDGAAVASRLPLTVNVVLQPPLQDNCVSVARRWVAPSTPQSSQSMADWLLQGPLSSLHKLELKQVEINAQIVRFPSGLETEFGGQAIYLLQIHTLEKGEDGEVVAVANKLENMPDVAALRSDDTLKAELVSFIETHLHDLDTGVLVLPEKFLDDIALSYSTLGVNRLANKPFDAIFPDGVELSFPAKNDMRFIGSTQAAIERLNNLSCVGCHQAQSTAGFHLLGEDDTTVSGVTNRLAVPFSPHFHHERSRRQAYVAQVANGQAPNRYHPHSLGSRHTLQEWLNDEQWTSGTVGVNMPCLPNVHADDVAAGGLPICDADKRNLSCTVVAQDPLSQINFGQCVVHEDNPSELFSGMTCRQGNISSAAVTESPFNIQSYKDTFSSSQMYDLPEDKTFSTDSFNCRPTRIGVPLGRTYRSCTAQERRLEGVLGDEVSDEICAVVGGSRFDQCVEGNFHACLEGIVARGMVDSCHTERFCREDYICQALPYQLDGVPTESGKAVADAGVGFCTPTYFVFQMRLDGHPKPI